MQASRFLYLALLPLASASCAPEGVGEGSEPLPMSSGASKGLASTEGRVVGCDSDLDCDGVTDRDDGCPDTPDGLRVVASGCSMPEILRGSERFVAPLGRAIAKHVSTFNQDRDFARLAKPLLAAGDASEGAVFATRAGDLCAAATRWEEARASLGNAHGELDQIEAEVLRNPPDFPSEPRDAEGEDEHEDASPRDLRLSDIDLARDALASIDAAAARAGEVFVQACKRVSGAAHAVGKVAETLDVYGALRLEDGTLVVVSNATTAAGIAKGLEVEVRGTALDDGVVWTDDVVIVNGKPDLEVNYHEDRCIELAIAPTQSFFDPNSPDPVVHRLEGYTRNLFLHLEDSARLAARFGDDCDVPSSFGVAKRYSLDVRIDYVNSKGTAKNNVALGLDLDVNDPPVQLPLDGKSGTQATLKVTKRAQTCQLSAQGKISCTAPVELATVKYPTRLYQSNAFCSLTWYDEHTLIIADKSSTDYDTTRFDFHMGLDVEGADAEPTFVATGWGAPNGVSSRPMMATIEGQDRFAIYNDDFYDEDDQLFPELLTGVTLPAGLMWPHIKGTRGGHPFWYACALQPVRRDAVDRCNNGIADSFYKLPVKPAEAEDWKQSQGVNGGFTHQGQWAWDMVAREGHEIRAARGGVVTKVIESNSQSCFAMANGDKEKAKQLSKDGKCDANRISVRHTDGSYARYFHMKKWGVSVVEGQRVYRGDPLGYVGTTGFSTSNHLHFDTKSVPGGITVPAYFQSKSHTCWSPKKGDALDSNNYLQP